MKNHLITGTLVVMLNTDVPLGNNSQRSKQMRLHTYHYVTRDEAQALVDLYAGHELRNFLGWTWEVREAMHISER
jgi:hypothetical protein